MASDSWYLWTKLNGLLNGAASYFSEITTARGAKENLNARLDEIEGPTGLLATIKNQFEADGTYAATGEATVWDDLRVSVNSVKVAGTKQPGWEAWLGGLYLNWFDSGTEEEVWFAVQMPHSWAGTTIKPHVHWTPKTTSDGTPANQVVEWGLEYTWVNIGQVFPATNTIYGTLTTTVDANIIANKHYMTLLDDIIPLTTQDGISSMLVCRLFRNATGVNDTYEADAGLIEFDIHYEINTLGSRSVSNK